MDQEKMDKTAKAVLVTGIMIILMFIVLFILYLVGTITKKVMTLLLIIPLALFGLLYLVLKLKKKL